jgi:hypothetical protein
MEATSTDKKTFQLHENGQQLGELIYENLFFHKAEIRLLHAGPYKIRPVGVFGTAITVTTNGTEIANLKMNWRGQIVLSFQDGPEYILKAKGVFNSKYIIENQEGEKLLEFDPTFNWSKFNYNYHISCNGKPQDILLVLLGIYASNYSIASMSGIIGGVS